ncbi:hypothetical protein WA158_004204 [Blastocystis sp. Blastoise]
MLILNIYEADSISNSTHIQADELILIVKAYDQKHNKWVARNDFSTQLNIGHNLLSNFDSENLYYISLNIRENKNSKYIYIIQPEDGHIEERAFIIHSSIKNTSHPSTILPIPKESISYSIWIPSIILLFILISLVSLLLYYRYKMHYEEEKKKTVLEYMISDLFYSPKIDSKPLYSSNSIKDTIEFYQNVEEDTDEDPHMIISQSNIPLTSTMLEDLNHPQWRDFFDKYIYKH